MTALRALLRRRPRSALEQRVAALEDEVKWLRVVTYYLAAARDHKPAPAVRPRHRWRTSHTTQPQQRKGANHVT